MLENILGQRLEDLIESIAAPTPSPGGGSAAAVAGMLSAALVRMVSHLTLGRKKYVAVAEDMQVYVEAAAKYLGELAILAEDDARAYEEVLAAYKLPKDTEQEISVRLQAIEDALRRAATVPLRTATVSLQVLELAGEAAGKANPNALTDVGVASLLAAAAIEGALMNVAVNIHSLPPDNRPAWAVEMGAQIKELLSKKDQLARAIREKVLGSISGQR